MQDQTNYVNKLALPSLAVVVLAVFAGFYPESQETRTPPASKANSHYAHDPTAMLPSGDHFMPALDGVASYQSTIWSDPFEHREAALQALIAKKLKTENGTNNASDRKQADHYQEVFDKILTTATSDQDTGRGNLLVMPVVVDGENNTSELNGRIGTRHAIENALAIQGFTMPYPDRMSYVMLDDVGVRLGPHGELNPEMLSVLPIKLYKRIETVPGSAEATEAGSDQAASEQKSVKYVAVLWIDRRWLGRKPLFTIGNIIQKAIGEQINDPAADQSSQQKLNSRASVAIIGPRYSENLSTIYEELSDDPPADYLSWFGQSQTFIFSSTATAPLEDDRKACQQAASNIQVVRTIGSNDMLVDTLITELRARSLLGKEKAWSPLGKRESKAVLFVESGSDSPASLQDKVQSESFTIIPFPKGIATRSGLQPSTAKDIASSPFDVRDYFDRKMMSLTGAGNLALFGATEVRLVGVFSNSTEDTLLILETAREYFPNARFFTVDMKWEYVAPENLKFTRHLLVASHYGLEISLPPNLCLHHRTPGVANGGTQSVLESIVFRSGYDTSQFLAANIALKNFYSPDMAEQYFDLWNWDKVDKGSLSPIMFEVGISGAIQLPPLVTPGKETQLVDQQSHEVNFVSNRTEQASFPPWEAVAQVIFLSLVAIVTGILLMLSFSGSMIRCWNFMIPGLRAKWEKSGIPYLFRFTLLLAVLTSGISILIFIGYRMISVARIEPMFPLFSGISIWPSLFVLLVIVCLCIFRICERMRSFPWGLPVKFARALNSENSSVDELSNITDVNKTLQSPDEIIAICTFGKWPPTKPNYEEHGSGGRRLLVGMPNMTNARTVARHVLDRSPLLDRLFFFPLWIILPSLCLIAIPLAAAVLLDNVLVIPPGRSRLANGLGYVLFYGSIISIFVCTATSLVQTLALRRVISLFHKKDFRKYLPPAGDDCDGTLPNVVQFIWWLARSTRASSEGLVFPSFLLFLFAVALLPVFDSWPVKTNMYFWIVFPFSTCILATMLVRFQARRLRNSLLEALKSERLAPIVISEEASAAASGVAECFYPYGQTVFGDSVSSHQPSPEQQPERTEPDTSNTEGDDAAEPGWTKQQLRDAIKEVETVHVGALGDIWHDPLLGSCMLLATTLLTGQGRDMIGMIIQVFGM